MLWVDECMGDWMIEWLDVIKGCCWSPDDAYLARLGEGGVLGDIIPHSQ
jgi:hypothetical protein